ncbi:MAG TPA: succinyl-diaminopimelate desuccinylase [Gammaproteobacteria bacterium]|nr:succinyl-diaminopimelate desuccinylase [Gammaproteobacteria bacterium]
MTDVLELAKALIACPSVTPEDAGCQRLLLSHLQQAGFDCEPMRFGQVDNLWAVHGRGGPLLVFAGHTDVVPPGPASRWRQDPFEPTVVDGLLYGRGAADMKGGLAAMVIAARRFVVRHPDHAGRIGFLITGDEEGPSVDGTVKVIDVLKRRGETINWCVVGEPSSQERFGDTIRKGRRGSLSGTLTVHGIQGHVAYPHRADNPVHRAIPALNELINTRWDNGNTEFPPTSFQISNFNAGTGAGNVIPGHAEIQFNLRYSTSNTAQELKQRISHILDRHEVRYDLTWHGTGDPFLTSAGKLMAAVSAAIHEVTGITPQPDTGGGTSDGRFIAPTGAEVIEFGPLSGSIHKVNEHVAVEDLEKLVDIYQRIMETMLIA